MEIPYTSRMGSVRKLLMKIRDERGIPYAEMSRAIGRNGTYIQQFIQKGTPQKLDEDDRARLSEFLEVPESLLRPFAFESSVLEKLDPQDAQDAGVVHAPASSVTKRRTTLRGSI